MRFGRAVSSALGACVLFGAASVFVPDGPAAAQEPGGLLVLDLPAGISAAAIGGAHPLARATGNAVFYHPGLLAGASGFGGSVAHYGSGATFLTASAAGSWWNGGISVGLQVLTYRPDPAGAAYESDLLYRGATSASQTALTVGYAREVVDALSIGLSAKMIDVAGDGTRDRVMAVDVGAGLDLGDVVLAASAIGVGPDAEPGGVRVSADPRLSLGVGTDRIPVRGLDLSGAAALIRDTDGSWTPGGGVEVSWWPVVGRRFIGRLGYRRVREGDIARGVTLGGGFEGDDVVIEYALQTFDGDHAVHRFGLRWR